MTGRPRSGTAARRVLAALCAAGVALAAAGIPVGSRDAPAAGIPGGETLLYDLLLDAPGLGRLKLGELVLTVLEDGARTGALRPSSPPRRVDSGLARQGARPEATARLAYSAEAASAAKAGSSPKSRTGAASSLVEMRMRSTNAMLEVLCPLRERWLSRVDRAGLFSLGYELTRRHRSGERTDKQTFDYAGNVGRWSRTEQDGRVKSGELALPGPVQDNVSWIYHVRGRLAAGERSVGFVTAERDHLRPAGIRVTGEEELDLGALGRVRALRASGEVDLGGLGAKKAGSAGDEPSLLWFEAETGILVKARIVSDYGVAELVLRESKGVAPFENLRARP